MDTDEPTLPELQVETISRTNRGLNSRWGLITLGTVRGDYVADSNQAGETMSVQSDSMPMKHPELLANEASLERGESSRVDAKHLPSGRSVVLRSAGGSEEIEIRSPSGVMEVRIVMSESGPVVTLRAARLELEAADELSLKCKRLAIDAVEDARIHTLGKLKIEGQEFRVKTTEDIHLNGAFVRLNCPEVGDSNPATVDSISPRHATKHDGCECGS